MHFQQATPFWISGSSADDVCAGLAMLHGCLVQVLASTKLDAEFCCRPEGGQIITMGTHVIDMAWALTWGTSCDLFKPSLFERDFMETLHIQKAQHFGYQGVMAGACVGLALLRGCVGTRAKLALAAFLCIALQSKWKANVSKV